MFEHVYIHIPFCHRICHYCDFAKTANFDSDMKHKFFNALTQQTKYLLSKNPSQIKSIFFGGGTPSIYDEEYVDFLKLFKKYLTPNCEITLEVNPEDLQKNKIKHWLDAGFNRFSIGIQSFNDNALNFLTRTHRKKDLEIYLNELFANIPNFLAVSFDLIYAWPGQNKELWEADLKTALSYPIRHLSCYSLGYEPRTVLGRKYSRGLIPQATSDEQSFQLFENTFHFLNQYGFEHYEISNYAKKSNESIHNISYWTYKNYLAIGPGAHGFVGSIDPKEVFRYSVKPSINRYCEQVSKLDLNCEQDLINHIKSSDIYALETSPTHSQWLLDYLATSLRYKNGTNISFACKVIDKDFIMNPLLKKAMESSLIAIQFDPNNLQKIESIKLSESEWFREQSWILQIHSCFI